jgi:hypothetical protein
MFNDIEGRVVLVKRDGSVIKESELEEIKSTYGAKSYIHFDALLDKNMAYDWNSGIYYERSDGRKPRLDANFVFGEKITPHAGRLPEKENELLLSLPISYQTDFGKNELKITEVEIGAMKYTVVGVHYYSDNNLTPKALLSESGFKFMSVYNKSFSNDFNASTNLYMTFFANFNPEGEKQGQSFNPSREQIFKELISVSFDESVVPSGKIAYCDSNYLKWVEDSGVEFKIPNDPANIDGLNFLSGMDLNEVKRKAMQGTILAHVDAGVPNLVIELDKRNAFTLGEMIYFFELACAISGYMLGVNPFDQPGVESYKKNMFALLGKPGYEEMRKSLEDRLNG